MGGFTFNCGKISTSLWDASNATSIYLLYTYFKESRNQALFGFFPHLLSIWISKKKLLDIRSSLLHSSFGIIVVFSSTFVQKLRAQNPPNVKSSLRFFARHVSHGCSPLKVSSGKPILENITMHVTYPSSDVATGNLEYICRQVSRKKSN